MKTQLNAMFWRDADLPGLEIYRIQSSSHTFPNHSHEQYAIGIMEQGGSYCMGARRTDSLVSSGDIALINPGQIHSGVPPQGVRPTYTMFYLEPEWLRQAAREMETEGREEPLFTSLIIRRPDLHSRFVRLRNQVVHRAELMDKESAMIRAFAGLLTTAGHRWKRPDRIGKENRAVRLIAEYLRSNLAERISLQNLADLTGLSRYHLLRLFKRATGMPPHAYHLQHRIRRAKILLLRGLPPAEVAIETGFSDQSHFCNTFRHFVGATPGQYLAL